MERGLRGHMIAKIFSLYTWAYLHFIIRLFHRYRLVQEGILAEGRTCTRSSAYSPAIPSSRPLISSRWRCQGWPQATASRREAASMASARRGRSRGPMRGWVALVSSPLMLGPGHDAHQADRDHGERVEGDPQELAGDGGGLSVQRTVSSTRTIIVRPSGLFVDGWWNSIVAAPVICKRSPAGPTNRRLTRGSRNTFPSVLNMALPG